MWPFKKKDEKLALDLLARTEVYCGLIAWWNDMKPDWVSIKKICPNIPTSWYVYENVTG